MKTLIIDLATLSFLADYIRENSITPENVKDGNACVILKFEERRNSDFLSLESARMPGTPDEITCLTSKAVSAFRRSEPQRERNEWATTGAQLRPRIFVMNECAMMHARR